MISTMFDLRATHNPNRWYLPLTDRVCVGPADSMFMFGGIGLAASIAALERTCARPVVWASAQYLSFARPGAVVDLDVRIPVSGHSVSQARVIGHVGDAEIFTVNAALGGRDGHTQHQWVQAPAMPPPHECETWPQRAGRGPNLKDRLEVRAAPGRHAATARDATFSNEGQLSLWLSPVEDIEVDASMLAVFADFVPTGTAAAVGRPSGGTSLDNTLRIVRIVPTRWVLCDIRVHGVHQGFAHGEMRLFAQTGELMALASQSLILRSGPR